MLKVLKRMDRKDKRFKQITGESFFVRSSGRMLVSEVDDIIDGLFRNRSKVKP